MGRIVKMNRFFNSNASGFPQSAGFLDRPRLRNLLEKAMDFSLVAVYAGSGYGKTRAVYSFLQDYDAHITWIQLSERDNVTTRFWENYTNMISINWPEIGEQLKKVGFPETEEAYAKYASLRGETLSPGNGKYILVYDDFHLLHNPAILRFFERASGTLPSTATIVIISRTMPEVNMFGMMLHERVFSISEETLRFTEDEIAEYFKQLALPVTRQDIRDIYEDTKGWAFAINLIGRSLTKNKKYERYALEAMKINVFKFIETEISGKISDRLWRFLLRVSLIDHLADTLIKTLANDETLIKEMEVLNAYIRFDYHLGAYMFHHLFMDYLRQNQHVLTDEEKQETWQIAGEWCDKNHYQSDALTYYEKSGDYDKIMHIVYCFDVQAPQDMARFVLEIFSRMPESFTSKDPLFPAMDLKLKMSLGQLNESFALAEQYVKEYESRPESDEKNRALAEIYDVMARLRMIMSPHLDKYDFDVYYEKQRYYYEKNPYKAPGPNTNQPVGSYAILVGTNRKGAPEEFIEALSRSIPHSSQALKGKMSGMDDLARGELGYFRREFKSAEQFLKQALDKARIKKQYDIQNRAILYLMLISLSHGKIESADALLQSSKALLSEKDYTTRYEAYDLIHAHYHLALGQPDLIPDWLKGDFSPCPHPGFMENFENRIKAQYHYMTRQYSSLLAFLKNINESQTVLLGRIVFKVLEALCLYQLKQRKDAIIALTEAYELSKPNGFIVQFAQFSKDMRTITAAAIRDEHCSIPADWLENINHKASAFAKKQAHLRTEYKTANNIGGELYLTKRETDVLKDLSEGLSRNEIAANQNISANTVKMIISIVYEKLYANNLADAIRIAAVRNII